MSDKSLLQNKMVGAAKWSFFGECASKLIVPITNMILARILIPDHFGVLSIVVMITNFADLFTDAGFQKYLVQHNFKSDEEMYDYASVAFWTNMAITIFIWLLIFVLARPLSIVLNKPGYQWVIRIGSMKLFLTAFTSVQRAIYQRCFDYKTVAWVRIIVALIPVVITIPLALAGFLYWSLIIGLLASELVYAVILTAKSKWKPKKYYSFEKLKKMFSFSIWSLVEQITIWLSCYADTLILSIFLTDTLVGMYKQPENMISSIFNIFSATFMSILFSALSRLNDQKDEKDFWNIVFKTQLTVATTIVPLSVGIYLYRELATQIMLGSQWDMAIVVVGLMALSTGIQTVMNNTASEIYRAKGEPKVSVLAQTLYIIWLIPLSVVSVKHGFDTFVKVRAFMSIIFMFIHYGIIRYRYQIRFSSVLSNVKYPVLASAVMYAVVWAVQRFAGENVLINLLGIPVGMIIYTLVVCCFKPVRQIIRGVIAKFPSNGVMGIFVRGIRKFLDLYQFMEDRECKTE